MRKSALLGTGMQPGAGKKAKVLEQEKEKLHLLLAIWPWVSQLNVPGFQHPCLRNWGSDKSDKYTLCCCEDSLKYQIYQLRLQDQTPSSFPENLPTWRIKQINSHPAMNSEMTVELPTLDQRCNEKQLFSYRTLNFLLLSRSDHDLDKHHLIRNTVGQGSC